MGKRSRRKAKLRPKPQQVQHAPQPGPRTEAEKDARLIELLAQRDQQMREAAYRMFLAEGGHVIEQSLENGQLTMAAYHSQIRAEKEGGSGWGPTVTPYEDRMTRSLQMRLMAQKREWIEDCRRRLQEDWDALGLTDGEDETEEDEAGEDENTPQPEDSEHGGTIGPAPEAATEVPVGSGVDGP